jgi:hypothetical protein
LTDFGIARKFKNNKLIKDMSGTPGYLSPEVLLQNNQTFSSDYFSLGIIIYELIFLQRPFEGKTKQELSENILNKNINLTREQLPINFRNSQSADDLVDFINKLLKRKKEKRLGDKDINQLIRHPWLKDVEWENIESKMLLEENIPFIPSKGDNFNFLKVNKHLNEKDKNYKSYLKLINHSTFFNDFYFNFYTKNSKISEDSNDNRNSFRRNSVTNKKNKIKIEGEENKEKSEGNVVSEFTLSEFDMDENDEDIILNRFSDYNGRFSDLKDYNKIQRLSYSPEKNK